MRNSYALPALAVAAMALSGCSPLLSSPEARARAAEDEAELVAEALSSLDWHALEGLICEEPFRVVEVQSRPQMSEPVAIEVNEFKSISLQGSYYEDPDPEAEFFSALLTGPYYETLDERVSLEALVRVDERGACMWALDDPLVVYLGL